MTVHATTTLADTLPALDVVALRDADHLAAVLEVLERPRRRRRRIALRREVERLLGEGTGFLIAHRGSVPVGLLAYRWASGALEVVYVNERPEEQETGCLQRLLQAACQIGVSLGACLISIQHRPETVCPASATLARRIRRPALPSRGRPPRRHRSGFTPRAS